MVTASILGLTLPAPMEEDVKALLGLINRRTMRQGTAVDANVQFLKDGSGLIFEAGRIVKIGFGIEVACAAGESYSIVLQKSLDGGTTWSPISGALVVDSDMAGGSLMHGEGSELYTELALTDPDVESGDMLRAAIDYTAGGGATPATGLTMFVDIAPTK